MSVEILVDGVDQYPDVHFPLLRFMSQVNGQPGEAKIRIRDDTSSKTFTPGMPVLLKIDGNNVWRGFVMVVGRPYIASAYNVAQMGLTRFVDLDCVDVNILLQRRIVYDKADPDNVLAPLYPPGTADVTAIAELVADWLDLTGDGIDTSTFVENVGDINVDQEARAWRGSYEWGQAMASIASLPAAIFYIDPDLNLVYTDVDTPNAPYTMSDVPGPGVAGYREMEILLDGGGLANDVLAWGLGYGSQTPVFTRDQDLDSQAFHGLWQVGVRRNGVYKQATINRIAESIIDGSPQSKRGSKDDKVAVMLSTYQPGFIPAQKIDFTSEVWDFNDVLPIRSMEITFEALDNPKYTLVLSHEIDAPWGFIDQFIVNFGLPEIGITGPTPPGIPWPPTTECDCGITDTFERETDPGWGINDAGFPWTAGAGSSGNAYTYDGIGEMNVSSANASMSQEFSVLLPSPVESQVMFRSSRDGSDLIALGGLATNQMIVGAITMSDDSTLVRVASVAAEWRRGSGVSLTPIPQLQFFRVNPSTLEHIDSPINFTKDTWYHLKFEVTAGQPLRAKVWQDGDPEPVSWITSTLNADATQAYTLFSLSAKSQSGTSAQMFVAFDNLDIVGVNVCSTARFDDFTRSVSGGWGTSTPYGLLWTVGSPGGTWDQSVAGGLGIIEVDGGSATGSIATTSGDGGPWVDSSTEWTMTITFQISDEDSTMTFAVVNPGPGGALGIQVGGTDIVISDVVSGGTASFTWVADTWYTLKLHYTAGVVLEGKAWVVGATEPAYQVTGVPDSSIDGDSYLFVTGPSTTANARSVQITGIDFEYPGQPCVGVEVIAGLPTDPQGRGCENAVRVDSTTYASSVPYMPFSTLVYVDGLLQRRGVDYTEDLPRHLLFSTPISESSTVRVCYYVLEGPP